MAVVVLGGLMTSTFLNMVVVPALFFEFGGEAEQGDAGALLGSAGLTPGHTPA